MSYDDKVIIEGIPKKSAIKRICFYLSIIFYIGNVLMLLLVIALVIDAKINYATEIHVGNNIFMMLVGFTIAETLREHSKKHMIAVTNSSIIGNTSISNINLPLDSVSDVRKGANYSIKITIRYSSVKYFFSTKHVFVFKGIENYEEVYHTIVKLLSQQQSGTDATNSNS